MAFFKKKLLSRKIIVDPEIHKFVKELTKASNKGLGTYWYVTSEDILEAEDVKELTDQLLEMHKAFSKQTKNSKQAKVFMKYLDNIFFLSTYAAIGNKLIEEGITPQERGEEEGVAFSESKADKAEKEVHKLLGAKINETFKNLSDFKEEFKIEDDVYDVMATNIMAINGLYIKLPRLIEQKSISEDEIVAARKHYLKELDNGTGFMLKRLEQSIKTVKDKSLKKQLELVKKRIEDERAMLHGTAELELKIFLAVPVITLFASIILPAFMGASFSSLGQWFAVYLGFTTVMMVVVTIMSAYSSVKGYKGYRSVVKSTRSLEKNLAALG